MPCTNCTAQQYADWVAQIAAKKATLSQNLATIKQLQEDDQKLEQDIGELEMKKQQCDMAGGPP